MQLVGSERGGDSNGAATGGFAGLHPLQRILEDDAVFRVDAQTRCGEEVTFGVGLAACDVIGGDDYVKVGCDAGDVLVESSHLVSVAAGDKRHGHVQGLRFVEKALCPGAETVTHLALLFVEDSRHCIEVLRSEIGVEDIVERHSLYDVLEVIDTSRETGVDVVPDLAVLGFGVDDNSVKVEKESGHLQVFTLFLWLPRRDP